MVFSQQNKKNSFLDNQTEYRYIIVNITCIAYNTLDYSLQTSCYFCFVFKEMVDSKNCLVKASLEPVFLGITSPTEHPLIWLGY